MMTTFTADSSVYILSTSPSFWCNLSSIVSVAYGVYLVTFGLCMQTLFWPRIGESKPTMNRPLALATIVMAISATLEPALQLKIVLNGFIYGHRLGGPEAIFKDASNLAQVLKMANIQVMALIGDGILIYRCFIIYSRRWGIVALPIVLLTANAVCGILQVHRTALAPHDIGRAVLGSYVTAFIVITATTNVLATSLIVMRILRVDSETTRVSRWSCRPAMKHIALILVESGLLYTTTAIISLVVLLSKSNGIIALSDVSVEIIGICFNRIIVRVNRGVTVGPTRPEDFSSIFFRSRGGGGGGGTAGSAGVVVVPPRVDAERDTTSVISRFDEGTKELTTIV